MIFVDLKCDSICNVTREKSCCRECGHFPECEEDNICMEECSDYTRGKIARNMTQQEREDFFERCY